MISFLQNKSCEATWKNSYKVVEQLLTKVSTLK